LIKATFFKQYSILFVIKLILVILTPTILSEFLPKFYDIGHFPDGYGLIANNIINGNGFRFFPETAETIMRPPGYIGILAILFYFFGESILAAQILNVIMALATAYVIKLICNILTDQPRVGNLAFFIYLFHPATILAETRGGYEILFAFLITVFIYVLYRSIESNRYKTYFLSGICLGLTMLVKSITMIFPVFFASYLIYMYNFKIKTSLFIKFGCFLAGICLIYSPWIIRNYYLTGYFVPAMTIKGVVAYQGMYLNKNRHIDINIRDKHNASSQEINAIAKEAGFKFKEGLFPFFYSTKDEVEFDKMMFNIVIDEYKKSPVFLLKCCILNFFRFWFGGDNRAVYLNAVLTTPFLLLTLIGVFKGFRQNINIGLIVLLIISYIMPHLPLLAQARFHVPLLPLLSIFVSYSLMANEEAAIHKFFIRLPNINL